MPSRRTLDAHFDEQVRFLQELVRVPTDTPPGNNTPHALRTRELLASFGFDVRALDVALYDENTRLKQARSAVKGINHGYINVGQIFGGTNTSVVPGKVVLKIDRRMIPEEDPVQVEAALRKLIENATACLPGTSVEIKRLLLAHAMKPLPGNKALVDALCAHATELFGEKVEASGTPLYTDARLFSERGIPAVISTALARERFSSRTPSEPTSTSSSKTCGGPPKSLRARCSTS